MSKKNGLADPTVLILLILKTNDSFKSLLRLQKEAATSLHSTLTTIFSN